MRKTLAGLIVLFLPALAAGQQVPPDGPPGLSAEIAEPREVPPAADPTPSSVRHGITFLPLGSRFDLLPFVGTHLPGVVRADGGLSVQGGEPRETQLELDGVRVRRLRVPMAILERLDVFGAGSGLRHADVTGGVISVTTASPGRRLRLGLDTSMETAPGSHDRLAATVSAPIGDRFSVLTGLEVSRADVDGNSDLTGILPTTDVDLRKGSGLVKLAWQPTVQHRVELLAAGALHRQDNLGILGRAPETQPRFDERWLLASLRWRGRLTSRVKAELQLAVERDDVDERPMQCLGSGSCDARQFINRYPFRYVSGNHELVRSDARTSVDLSGALHLQVPVTAAWLGASLLIRPYFRAQARDHSSRTPGDALDIYQSSGAPESRTTFFANNPRYEPGRIGAFTFNSSSSQAGAALEAPLVLFSRLHLVPGAALITGRAETGGGEQLADTVAVPQLRVLGQPILDRDLWIRASSARRADLEFDSIAELARPVRVSRTCLWNTATQEFDRECALSGASPTTVGLRCGMLGLQADGTTCAQSTRAPRMWEHTLGVESAVLGGLRAGLDLVERHTRGGWNLAETNRIWNVTRTNITGYRNQRAETVVDLSQNPDRRRRHRAISATLVEQWRGVDLLAAYTWARTVDDDRDQSRALVMADDGRHFLHLRGILDLSHLTVGLLYAYAQGASYTRGGRGLDPIAAAYDAYRASRGINPGANINDPTPRPTYRLPSEKQLHLQLRLRGKRLTGVDADLYLDVLEMFGSDPQGLAPDFTNVHPGRELWWRLGAELRY